MKIFLKILLFVSISIIYTNCSAKNSELKDIVSEEKVVELLKDSTPLFPLQPNNNAQFSQINSIPPPAGFEVVRTTTGSYEHYLQNFPLKTENNRLYLYNGNLANTQHSHFAILKIDVGNKDLQQCADAIMRLRAEYFWQIQNFSAIHFNFTSGSRADYIKYREGYRATVSGNTVSWHTSAQEDTTYTAFRKYMDLVFMYCGTASLSKELEKVDDAAQLQIGDIFIQGGFPGHAVQVVNVAKNSQTGEVLFLLSQSFMPAQEIHIIINPQNSSISPWYKLNTSTAELITPAWTFRWSDLKRFAE